MQRDAQKPRGRRALFVQFTAEPSGSPMSGLLIAKALRDNGNKVIYFAGYKRGEDLFKREEIEARVEAAINALNA